MADVSIKVLVDGKQIAGLTVTDAADPHQTIASVLQPKTILMDHVDWHFAEMAPIKMQAELSAAKPQDNSL
jgi:hypothetical protein